MQKITVMLVLLTVLVPSLVVAQGFPIAAPGTEGLRVVVSQPGEVIATYLGNSANYSNDLYFGLSMVSTDLFIFNNHSSPVGSQVNLGSFPIGTELFFRLHVNNTGYDFFTGPGDRNPDGQPHARVQEEWQPSETLVSFEDHVDFYYNDLSFSFTNTATTIIVCDANGPYVVLIGQPIQFDGSGSYATNSTIITYEWDFGDGNTGSGITPTHTYVGAGLYTVTLCVTDDLDSTSCCETETSVLGACCFSDFSCQDMTVEDCAAAGGFFVQGGSCDQTNCQTVPTEMSTWGRVKMLYR